MAKFAFLHFAGKLPRDTGDKMVVAVAMCADYDGYTVLDKHTRLMQNEQVNNKYSGLMALEAAFDYLYEKQSQMLKAGVTRVYLVTDSSFTYGYLTKKSTNDYVREYLEKLYKRYSFGGPKELLIGVGVAEQCYRNSAKSRCDMSLIAEQETKEKEQAGKELVYCFPDVESSKMTKLTDLFNSMKKEDGDE